MSKVNIAEVQKGFYFLIDGAPVEILATDPLVVHKWDGCKDVMVELSELRPIKLNEHNLKCFGFEPDGWHIDEITGERHNESSRGKHDCMFRRQHKTADGGWDDPLLIGHYGYDGLYSIGGFLNIKYFHQMQMIMHILGCFDRIELDHVFC